MRRLLTAIMLLCGISIPTAAAVKAAGVPSAPPCAAADNISDYFGSNAELLGGDYQRSLPLPDGRVLWTFQDAFVRDGRGDPQLIHNAGVIQRDKCFRLLQGGTTATPQAWILPEKTQRLHRWFWPLASAVANDGKVRVFLAEMRERGDHYLAKVEPVATWIATLRADDLKVIDTRVAPDSSPHLYGWSITSDRQWSYLYGYCYRQFGWDPVPFGTGRGHDLSCSADVRLARVRRGRLDDSPTYWDGRSWTADASAAVPVMPRSGRPVNPAQIAWSGTQFVAVTKAGDWFGDTMYVDVAPTAHGPWTTISSVALRPLCDACVTYFASFVPVRDAEPEVFTFAVSNNTWDGQQLRWYHPTFITTRSATGR